MDILIEDRVPRLNELGELVRYTFPETVGSHRLDPEQLRQVLLNVPYDLRYKHAVALGGAVTGENAVVKYLEPSRVIVVAEDWEDGVVRETRKAVWSSGKGPEQDYYNILETRIGSMRYDCHVVTHKKALHVTATEITDPAMRNDRASHTALPDDVLEVYRREIPNMIPPMRPCPDHTHYARFIMSGAGLALDTLHDAQYKQVTDAVLDGYRAAMQGWTQPETDGLCQFAPTVLRTAEKALALSGQPLRILPPLSPSE